MKNGTILIAIGPDADLAALEPQLEAIRTIPAQIVIVITAETPPYPNYTIGVPPYGSPMIATEWQSELATLNISLETKAKGVTALLEKHGVAGEVGIIATEHAVIADAIAQRAMLCDVVLIGDDLRAAERLFRQVAYGVLFQSPVGIILNDPQAKAVSASKKVFVAWTPHLHSARAIHQMLPLLQQSEEVIVAVIDPVMGEFQDGEDPGIDVAKWLTHHGCTVSVRQYPSGGQEVGACILARARDCGADLIVMGAYGHSRTREAIFGGTTRTLITQTDQAVFLAH
ncbi:MAG: universal stress protein [Paracoccaceae bacterium]